MKKLKCYVAGKLSDPTELYIQNLHKMCIWSEKVRKLGVAVYVPGIDFMLGFLYGNWTYKDYFENSQPWLEASDFVFLVPGYEDSEGTAKEITTATDVGIPVFYYIPTLKLWMKKPVYNQRKEQVCLSG